MVQAWGMGVEGGGGGAEEGMTAVSVLWSCCSRQVCWGACGPCVVMLFLSCHSNLCALCCTLLALQHASSAGRASGERLGHAHAGLAGRKSPYPPPPPPRSQPRSHPSDRPCHQRTPTYATRFTSITLTPPPTALSAHTSLPARPPRGLRAISLACLHLFKVVPGPEGPKRGPDWSSP